MSFRETENFVATKSATKCTSYKTGLNVDWSNSSVCLATFTVVVTHEIFNKSCYY